MSDEATHDQQVIVVGAGLGGLAAATRLVDAGREVVVLEARDRVGGRTENGHLSDGQWIELGGQWLGQGHDRMYALVDELGLSTFPLYNTGLTVLYLKGKHSTVASARGSTPKWNPVELADLALAVKRFNALAATVDLERPWDSQDAKVLDRQTFRTWINRNARTKLGRTYFQIFSEAVFAADPADLSMLHVLYYAKSNTDIETLMSVDGGAQRDRILGGSALVSERLAERLQHRVRLSSPVRTIRHGDGHVEVFTRGGEIHRGSAVIVTLPPTLAGRLEYEPALPSWRDQLCQRLPAGSVFKVYLVYERPFWRNNDLNGQVASDLGPVKVTFDNTPPDYERGVIMGFIDGNDAREWAKRSPAERRDGFIRCLVTYFGEEARHPAEYLEKDWMADEFTRGCYSSLFGPGVWTSYGPALREPVGRIHWAGTECAPEWNGYMEGAVRSGEAVAATILAQ